MFSRDGSEPIIVKATAKDTIAILKAVTGILSPASGYCLFFAFYQLPEE
ncbi:hypothetical protein [Bartonella choladocola]|nr:hypothetical protein [Bartonella choladocola]